MLVKGDLGDEEGSHFCKSVESGNGVSIYPIHRLYISQDSEVLDTVCSTYYVLI